MLQDIEEKLSLTGKYSPIRVTITPLSKSKNTILRNIISRIKEETNIPAKNLSKLSEKLEKRGYMQLSKRITEKQEYNTDTWISRLLSSIKKSFDTIPVLMIDDIHYMEISLPDVQYPVLSTSVLPIPDIKSITLKTLSIDKIHLIIKDYVGKADWSGSKTLKELTGGVPSYIYAILPRFSDWVKRKSLSLDESIVRKVWEEELRGGILSLIARSYLLSYLSLFDESIITCFSSVAKGDKIGSCTHTKLRQIGLIKEGTLIDKTLTAWLKKTHPQV